ncbi:AMP-dependent synthetase, partial [Vibrio breoganii]
VGQAGPGIELKIAEDEEILVRSKGMFSGYYKNDEATARTFGEDGWLHTGDIGSIDSEGYLTIQGRKKDTFKNAKGKFVAPVPIEKAIIEVARVEMLCLVGLGMPAPILLVVPHDFPNFDKARYEKSIAKAIKHINETLEGHEKIKGVLLIKDLWSIENEILTPTLKIKRHVLEKKYHDVGAEWPKDKFVVWEE